MIRDQKGEPFRVTCYPVLILNIVLQVFLERRLFHVGKRTKGMDICLGDCELDCLINLRVTDEVLLFATTQEQLQKMMCAFKHSTEKGDASRYIKEKTETSYQPKLE